MVRGKGDLVYLLFSFFPLPRLFHKGTEVVSLHIFPNTLSCACQSRLFESPVLVVCLSRLPWLCGFGSNV